MKNLHAQVPDLLLDEITQLAANQNASVDQIVSVALAAQVSAWRTRESAALRAARVNWGRVDEILDKVPNGPPALGDELP